ncbi:MAG: serine O-acetyltransferase [Gammaproteobacteria bacterium]|jgi:serine O-acetyltransferase|nr:serine O-acetyltransferase [Gammaproteobacteria bacterium]
MHYSVSELIKADLYRYYGRYSLGLLLKNMLNANRGFRYSFWLRLCNSSNLLVRTFARLMHRRLSTRYQIQIPPNTKIGPGLYLGHGTSIIVNEAAVIGNNCNLSHFVTIGSNSHQAAIIGDNVYIGPNTCIIEHVNIGNDATIGAGAIVIKDVPSAVTVAGNPARIISTKQPGRFVQNRFENSVP